MRQQLTLAGRVHAVLTHRLIPTLDRQDAIEAALVFDELRRDALERSLGAWIAVWWREARALAATTADERRRMRRGKGPGWGWIEAMATDVSYGARHLFRSPVFTITSAASVAVGIAAVVCVFTAVYGVLWRPLEVPNPDQLVRVAYGHDNGIWSYQDFEDATGQASALSSAAAFSTRPIVMTAPGEAPRETLGDSVSRSFFSVVGLPMAAGRGFAADDPDDVVVISTRLWQQAFGGSRSVIGQRLDLQGRPHVIIGVAPPHLQSLESPVQPTVWFPIQREQREHRGRRSLRVAGRLAQGATLRQAQAQLDAAAHRLFEASPELHRDAKGEALPILVTTELEGRLPASERASITAAVSAAFGLVALILAMAASNVANLLLGRATERRPEIAVRLALGAGRSRVIRQLLAESLILAAISGGLALLTVRGALVALSNGLGSTATSALAFSIDWRVTLFAAVVTIGVGVLFGLAPALQASRFDLMSTIRGAHGPLAKFGLRRVLVNVQVAGAVLLTTTALLFLNGLNRVRHLDPGFDPTGVTTLKVDLRQRQYSAEKARTFFDEATARLSAEPGVTSVAWAQNVPLSGNSMVTITKDIEGYEPSPGDQVRIGFNVVTPGYFELVRIPLRRGREFTSEDRIGATQVVIVNEAMARKFWPEQNPLGKRIDDRRIVGVTANIRAESLNDLNQPYMWIPVAQSSPQSLVAHVRTVSDAPADPTRFIRVVNAMDPGLIVGGSSMEEMTGGVTLAQRLISIVCGTAGITAIALAMVGIYGVMAYRVRLRTRELGVRIALGASPRMLMRQTVIAGIRMTTLGIACGVAFTVIVAFGARAGLAGVEPADPVAYLGAVGLVLLATAIATFVPARRVANVSPAVALRQD